jgi:prepilin-type processing-associated H-X9-DG protein
MKQLLVLFLVTFTAVTTSWANLGDGFERVDDSYGNIVQRKLRDDGSVSVLYHKDRYLCQVTFADGHSVSESYFHVKGTDLSEKEISRFLKANGFGATWTPDSKGSQRRFRRSDGRAEATYGDVNGRPALTVRELREGRGRRSD